VGDRQALLDQGDQLVFAEPLTPAGQRAALEEQFVTEAQLAAEVLVIGVLHPARAEHLVGEVLGMLEDEEAGHQPRLSTGTEVSPIVGFQNSLVGGFELVR
jgi:hypothetical protein